MANPLMPNPMKKPGFTTWLGCYTDSQYIMASTLAKELAFRLLSVILLYFNMSPTKFIGDDKQEIARNCFGWAGLAFSSLSFMDAVFRPKYKYLRILDEAAIVSIFISLSALFFTMFKKTIFAFMCIGVSVIIAGISIAVLNRCEKGEVKEELNEDLRLMIDALKQDPSIKDPQILMQLKITIFNLMAINPENAVALALLNILKDLKEEDPTI